MNIKLIIIIPFITLLLGNEIQQEKVAINAEHIIDILKDCPTLVPNVQSDIVVSIPSVKSSLKSFHMFYSPVMPPSLIKKYPDIRTYTGMAIENPSERLSITVSNGEIKGMILGNNGTFFIDPVESNPNFYRISQTEKGISELPEISQCGFGDSIIREDGRETQSTRNFPSCVGEPEPCYSIGDTLVTFRFAGILTAEANNEISDGTVIGGLAWMNAIVNQVNLLWARELSFKLELIENSDVLIYTDDNPTPTDFTLYNMYDELPLVLNHLNETVGGGGYNGPIGSLNWEYGAVFNVGYGGGLAYVPGSTSANLPYYTIFNHEIGHNLGSSHNCTSEGGWRCTFGGTIMCSRSNTLSGNNGDQYSSHTIDIAIKYQQELFGGNAYLYQRGWTRVPTDNSPPEVSIPFEIINIPKETPFVLEGSAEDETAENLTFSWEQNDISTVLFSPPDFPEDTGPLFCSVDPKVDGHVRYFPQIASLLENNYETGNIEKLPFAEREINMRLLARDNDYVSGGFGYADIQLNVMGDAGPFRVTSQSDAVTWVTGGTETITWDVANTNNAAGVSSPFVGIYLSVDGGENFDIILSSATYNDGSEDIIVPIVPTSDGCRIMVKSLNNIFFDINNSYFTIQNSAESQLTVDTTPIEMNLPLDTTVTLHRDVSNTGDIGSVLSYELGVDINQNGEGFLSFDGEDDNVDLGANLLDGDGDFSISLWVKTTASAGVIIQQRNGGFNGEYQLNVTGNGRLNFWTYRDGYRWAATTIASINDGEWHHVVVVQDETINGGRIYVDGQENASNSDGLVNLAGSIHTYLGADMRDHQNYFSGSINDVGLFTNALSVENIDILFNSGPSFNLTYNHDGYSSASNLKAFYPMTLMSGTTLSDESGNGHDGEISGASWDGDLVPTPEWLMVSGAMNWLEAGESDQISITVNTVDLQDDAQYGGQVLILISGDVVSIPVFLTTGDYLSAVNSQIPNDFKLFPTYPNPFNPTTTLRYNLPEDGLVNITIYDMMGREVQTLVNGKQVSGEHEVVWDATGFASGVYFVLSKSGNKVHSEKILFLK